jgi:cardiolipin synthase A/B
MSLSPALLSALAELAKDLPINGGATLVRVLARATPQDHEAALRSQASLPLSQQSAVERLMRQWRSESTPPLGTTLGAALEAMCTYDVLVRQELRAEVVWTGPRDSASGLRRTEQVILEMIGEARDSIWLLAFAAYRVPAIAQALGMAVARGVRLRYVVEDHDISAGKVSFNPLPALVAPGLKPLEVYVWPIERRPTDERGRHGTLHAKGLVIDERMAFVTSANLTEDALNLNMELGVVLRFPAAAKEIAAQLEGMVGKGELVLR